MEVPVDGELAWSWRAATVDKDEETIFLLDPKMGLMDLDFHPVTGRGWDAMKASTPDYAAMLFVDPATTIDRIFKALEELAQKGSYRRVAISIRNS